MTQKDISKTEQTSIVLRYFDKSNNSIIERFLGFFQPNGLDAESLVICITDALKKHNVNINNCIAQAYDGASVMSGDIGGVQRKNSRVGSTCNLCALLRTQSQSCVGKCLQK